jgi:alkyl hydroperoxide reductase subunit AhpC
MAAVVPKEAPDYTATAVVNEEFKQVKLSSYRGKHVVPDALQHLEQHGQVGPAYRKKGDLSFDPERASEYFQKLNAK